MVGIRLSQDICIPSCGMKKARQVVSQVDCGDSWDWLVSNKVGQVLTEAEYAEAMASPAPVQADEPDDDQDEDEGDDEMEGDETEKPESSDVSSEASAEDVPAAEPLSEGDKSVLDAVKSHLANGKAQLKTILLKTGLTEDVVGPVLTEANGIRKNQQGWYVLI